jgi:transcriptional regulator with XRE-family HTH domain
MHSRGDKEEIAKKIRSLREEHHMTQKDLAKKMSNQVSTISIWESGTSFPRVEALCRLADIFGITYEELVGIEKPEEKPIQSGEELAKVLEEGKKKATIMKMFGLKYDENSSDIIDPYSTARYTSLEKALSDLAAELLLLREAHDEDGFDHSWVEKTEKFTNGWQPLERDKVIQALVDGKCVRAINLSAATIVDPSTKTVANLVDGYLVNANITFFVKIDQSSQK